MSWIDDVKYELYKLSNDSTSLRKFGISVGLVFSVLGVIFYVVEIFDTLKIIILVIGIILFSLGALKPLLLRRVHFYWMGLAFTLGWFVSRFILSILFFIIIPPFQ